MRSMLPRLLPETVVFRQPVVRPDRSVHGYAISVVVRAPDVDAPSPRDERHPDDLVHAEYEQLNLATLAGSLVVFARATTAMLRTEWPLPDNPGGVILEVPRTFAALPDAVEHLVRLRASGIGLALDDYRPGGEQDLLLPHVDFAKVNLDLGSGLAGEAIAAAHRAAVTVVAERVNTEADVTYCAKHDVELLQGPLFQRDAAATRRDFTAGEQQCFELLRLLAVPGPAINHDSVVNMIGSDPELTLRVLALVNSSAYSLRTRVDSIRHAVVLLGPEPLSALAAAALVQAGDHTMSGLWFVLTRALACRTLAEDDAAYTVGLLSAVSAQRGIDPDVLILRTGVSYDVAAAVRSRTGPFGPVLSAVLAYEENDFTKVQATGLPLHDVASAYFSAVADSLETVTTLSDLA